MAMAGRKSQNAASRSKRPVAVRRAAKKLPSVKKAKSALGRSPGCDLHMLAASSSVDDLGLVEFARSGAVALQQQFPNIVFTSGRRNAQQQASAMAGNIVQNRRWIEQTYRPSAERDTLQQWVNDNPGAVTAATIAAGLLGIMNGWNDAQKGKFSRHFSGQAFDVQPVADNGAAVKKFIRQLPHLEQFLESEGGLVIWHAAFEMS
jgi:hypothetical protein